MAAELMNSTVNERVRGSEEKERESSCEKSTLHTEVTPLAAADMEMSHSTPLD